MNYNEEFVKLINNLSKIKDYIDNSTPIKGYEKPLTQFDEIEKNINLCLKMSIKFEDLCKKIENEIKVNISHEKLSQFSILGGESDKVQSKNTTKNKKNKINNTNTTNSNPKPNYSFWGKKQIENIPIKKNIYYYSNQDDINYIDSISNYLAENSSLFNKKYNIKIKILEENKKMICENKTILYTKSCYASRIKYESFKNEIKTLQDRDNRVILTIILMGSNSQPISIDEFKGELINFNLYDDFVCNNENNKESLKKLLNI